MRRAIIPFIAFVAVMASVSATPATAKPRGINGKIVTNSDNLVTGEEQVYTVDPDATNQQLVYNNSEVGQWSPDGTRIALVTQLGPPQVLLFNVNNGSSVYFGLPFDLYPDLALFCTVWSPDGARLACEGQGQTDPSLTGVYTLRSSDGGDLQRVTSDPTGDDCPSDYSPNGKRLVITRANDTTYEIDTVKLDGSGLTRITPEGMDFNFCNGNWSPQGNQIVFSAHVPNGRLPQLRLGRALRRCGSPAAPYRRPLWRPVLRPDHVRLLQSGLVARRAEDRLRAQPGRRAARPVHRQRRWKRPLPGHAHA